MESYFSASAATSNLAGLQSIYVHCFPDGRTRKEGLAAGTFSVIWAWGNLEGRLSLLAGSLVASHFALGMEIEKSVMSVALGDITKPPFIVSSS